MDVRFTHGAGLDVHQKTVMACRVTPDPAGEHADGVMELQACGAMTVKLLALSDGLAAVGLRLSRSRAPASTGNRSLTS